MSNLLFTLGVGAGFFLAMYQWITMLAVGRTDGKRNGRLMVNARSRVTDDGQCKASALMLRERRYWRSVSNGNP